MNITITGSLGNISRPLIQQLVAAGHQVSVISSSTGRTTEIEALNAKPLIGSLEDAAFVAGAFRGADAVYTMVPPYFSVPDYNAFADRVQQNYVQAIAQNGIRYVANLSSIGSALAGVAPLDTYYNMEQRLDTLPGVNVVHLRPAMFYTNFYGGLQPAKHQGVIGHNVDGAVRLLLTHPGDIADAAFKFLNNLSFEGRQTRYIVSDIRRGKEVAEMLGAAIGKPLHWVRFPDEDLLAGLMQSGFSKDAAEIYVINMGKAIQEGLLDDHFEKHIGEISGRRRLSDFAQEWAAAYQYS